MAPFLAPPLRLGLPPEQLWAARLLEHNVCSAAERGGYGGGGEMKFLQPPIDNNNNNKKKNNNLENYVPLIIRGSLGETLRWTVPFISAT